MCRSHMQTLAELLPSLDYAPQALPSGAVVYPDSGWRNERQRAQLWQLRDYQVSSVSGGSIWLLPRDVEGREVRS